MSYSLETALHTEIPTRHFVSCWISGRLHGIDILQIREINSERGFTPIFHAPPQVRGYVNIRGQIHLVIDPRIPLCLPEAPPGALGKGRQQLLIFKPHVAETFALLVDSVGDIIEVQTDRIEPPENATPVNASLSAGVCKLDGQLMELLEPRCFLNFAL
jgi:purine-binding chemotaxis protein CheW